jgi:hypothetical protein
MNIIEKSATASTYIEQAAELRLRATCFKSETNRHMLIKAAKGYEQMAKWAGREPSVEKH